MQHIYLIEELDGVHQGAINPVQINAAQNVRVNSID